MSLLSSVLHIFRPRPAVEEAPREPDPARRRTVVVARNYREANFFARENGWGPRDFIYASDWHRLRGHDRDNTLVILYGDWWDRPDSPELAYALEPYHCVEAQRG
jgi:hypothetical protein